MSILVQNFENRTGVYLRFDLGISYKISFNNAPHSINLDAQNVTNRENLFGEFYQSGSNEVIQFTQTGLRPLFNYRIEF